MDEKEFLKVVEKGESERVEFKKSTAQMERALKAMCSFLNHKGGAVYFGVSDKGKVVGQEVSDSTLKTISQKIRQKIKPEVSPGINVFESGGKNVVEVKVAKGTNKPYYLDGIAYRRAGSESPVIAPEELEKIILGKKRTCWDSEVCEGATFDDIDAEKVEWFLKEAKNKRGVDIPANAPLKEALMRLKLLHGGKLTNAAVLLFAKEPQKYFIQSEVKCIRFRGTDVTGPMVDMKVIESNIIEQVTDAEKFIFDHISLSSWIEDWKIQRQEKWEYPPKAIREALANAIAHRDYSSASKVQVRIFDDRMEFWNPGRLPEGWTIKKLKQEHESEPFNPLIAKQFFWIKHIEEVGTGTNKIVEWCVDWGLPEPVFEFTGTSLITILKKPFNLADLEKSGLNERQIKAIKYVEKKGSITNREYMITNNISRNTATIDLADLVKRSIFIRVGKGKRGLKYELYMKSAKKVQKKVQKRSMHKERES